MKRNDITQLHQMKAAELQQKLATVSQELAKAQMEAKVAKLSNYRLIRSLRKDIARIKTVMTENELTANTKEAEPKK